MARRRSITTRVRDYARKRGPRRPPGAGWTIAELEQFAQVTRRTIADYVRRGLLSPPEFRGTATRYQRHHLLRLLAVRLMKADGVSRLSKIQRRLQAMGDQQIETWVLARPLPAAAAQALQQDQQEQQDPKSATSVRRTATASTQSPAAKTTSQPAVATESWQRAVLLPGIELTWRNDAGPLVERVAKRFTAQLLQLVNEATGERD